MESVKRKPFRWVSTVAYKEIDKIVTRGFNTTELVDKGYGIADMIFINYQSRIPKVNESKMLDYVMVVNLEGGLDNAAAIARIVAMGDTFMTQACGASILAFGHAYGGFSDLGSSIQQFIEKAEENNLTYEEAAELYVEYYNSLLENQGRSTLGVSDVDIKNPTPWRMFARAEKLGIKSKNIKFMEALVKVVKKQSPETVDLDLFGATCAVMLDLGFTPEAMWTIIALVRAYAAGAHAIEEIEEEPKSIYNASLTPKELYIGAEDKEIPSQEERDKVVVSNKSKVGNDVDTWLKDLENKKKERASGWVVEEELPYLKEMSFKKL